MKLARPCLYVVLGALTTLVAVVTPSLGVPIPYFEDFNDAAEVLTESRSNTGAAATSTWTLTGGAYQHSLGAPGTGATQYAGATVFGDELTKPNDFLVQATFNVSDISGTSGVSRVGLVGLAKASNVVGEWNANAIYYAGEIEVSAAGAGKMTIRKGRGNTNAETIAGTSGTGGVVTMPDFQLNTTYTMTLIGDYNASGDLTLSFKVNGTTLTAATILAANVIDPGGGRYFGLRDYTDNNRTLTVTYDNLSISNVIPEPASLGLFGAGAMLMAFRRRRTDLARRT